MTTKLEAAFQEELASIAKWWIDNTIDEVNGGFVGEISAENERVVNANKGIILNTRILWFFSEAALFVSDERQKSTYTSHALRAYNYLIEYFLDRKHGGVHWELNVYGEVLSSRKQVYAQAFAIYGLASYFRLTGDEAAINLAYKTFELIERHAFDKENEGYIEAFNGDWSELSDFRLSEKDLNSPKSMNTHLHVLEAYTNLYRAGKQVQVSDAVRRCLGYFDEYIIDHERNHLRMFQSMDWTDMSYSFSYGHDIESSWLIYEAVELLDDPVLSGHFKPIVLGLVNTCFEQGMGAHSELLDAYNFQTKTFGCERVWWVQAEALLGFLTAFSISGEKKFRVAAEDVWHFIQKHQIDKVKGEWHWLSLLDVPLKGEYKMGFWKAPYHNGRAMMQAARLVKALNLE